jgi:hypothetical protein
MPNSSKKLPLTEVTNRTCRGAVVLTAKPAPFDV